MATLNTTIMLRLLDELGDIQQYVLSNPVSLLLVALVVLWRFVLDPPLDKTKFKHPLPPISKGGFLHSVLSLSGVNFHNFVLEKSRTEGKILRLPFWPVLPRRKIVVLVMDPVVARKILENPRALKWRELYDSFRQLVGGICFISEEGERYKHSRKAALVGMGRSNLRHMLQCMQDVMDGWIPTNLSDDVSDIEIAREMQKCTIRSISKIAFGYEISEDEQERTLYNLCTAMTESSTKSDANPLRRSSLGKILFAGRRQADRCTQELRETCRKMLHLHRAKGENANTHLVLDSISKGSYENGDDDRISDLILLYGGGFDTTGYNISFALTELAKHPNVQSELRLELRKLEPANQTQCPLLQRVIKETLRLWPAASGGGGRIVPEDVIVDGGRMMIPKGSICFIPTFPTQRDEDIFDRPDEWLPSRWENPTKAMKDAFMPFLIGRRNCPGQLLALAETEIFLARLIRDYEWTLIKEGPARYSITLKNHGTILRAKKVSLVQQ